MKKKNPAAVALGRRGGSVASEAQKAAARENGKLGGRPPLFCARCGALKADHIKAWESAALKCPTISRGFYTPRAKRGARP